MAVPQRSQSKLVTAPRVALPPPAGDVGSDSDVQPRDSVSGPSAEETSPVASETTLEPNLEKEVFGNPQDGQLTIPSPHPTSQTHPQGTINGYGSSLGQLDGIVHTANDVYPEQPDNANKFFNTNGHREQSPTSPIATINPFKPDHSRLENGIDVANEQEKPTPPSDGATSLANSPQPTSQLQSTALAVSKAGTSLEPISAEDEHADDRNGTAAAEPTVAQAPAVQIPGQANSMPPPAAPASMLWSLKPSNRAQRPNQQLTDPSISRRLIAVTVILFRQGKANEAKALGQFTIDLIGKITWNEELPVFLQADALPDDKDAIMPLLGQAVEIIKVHDLESAGFLDGMIYLMN